MADRPAYRRAIAHDQVNYLNPSNEEIALAHEYRRKPSATLSQAQLVIRSMPHSTDIELSDRAILACAFLTGARVSALRTLKLKHVLADGTGILQDANEVEVKFAKSQVTRFFPVGEDIRRAFSEYVEPLQSKLDWKPNDPLFPSTEQRAGEEGVFRVVGLSRCHWNTPDPIRTRFRRAFEAAGVQYLPPHRARNSITTLGLQTCESIEAMKAWSQNSGHESVLTTLRSYEEVSPERQAEIPSEMARPKPEQDNVTALAKLMLDNPKIAELFARISSPEDKGRE
ncbi:tyrosine-type recombinase/integrase [Tsuneonella amylolytica]|uniref:tyrosine-type recombinase/integrase n=1 Tax=Tsuneonella amylolytica TaxID=2338327 RepID=UPI0013C50508|nr:site-specific integrase [Tsuneonella amylolytica]